MTKDFDVSKIDVGWRVQLDAANFNNDCKKLHGVWATVSSLQAYGLYVVDHLEGEKRYLRKDASRFLAALPPEPAKDPFSVGEWVVCVDGDALIKEGWITQIEALKGGHARGGHFFADGWFLMKRRFRPATPEEITAHLEKKGMVAKPVIPTDTHEMQEAECSPDECLSYSKGCDAKEKITFTVAGREFFVGQRVYANTKGTVGLGKLINVPHEVTGCVAMAELVCIRAMDGFNQRVIASSCLSEAPLHEWQFGDQASHPDHGKVLVIDMTGPEGFRCASPSDPKIFIYQSELTFIRRTDLGE